MRKIILSSLMLVSMAACSTDPRLAELENAQRREAAQVELAKAITSEIPDWYVKPPAQDGTLYSAGAATSLDLALATEKAVLDAKRALADQLQSKLSNQAKQYVKEAGNMAATATEFERSTSNLTSEVVVPGYIVQDRLVQPNGAGFRVYVLLKYTTQQTDLSSKLTSTKAFKDLEAKVEAARLAANAKPVEEVAAVDTPAPSKSKAVAFPIGSSPPARDDGPPPVAAAPRPAVEIVQP